MVKRIIAVSILFIGIIVGAWWFRDVRPRSLLSITSCSNCLHPNEISGAIAAGLFQNHPDWVPSVVIETERAVAIRHPAPSNKYHFVVFPKKDIKNLGDTGEAEREFLSEVMVLSAKLIHDFKLKDYRVWSNGPRTQLIGYLHFHVAGTD